MTSICKQGEIKIGKCRFNEKGLIHPGKISYDDWTASFVFLKDVEVHIQFWLGDLMNYGEQTFGENYAQALEAADYSLKSLKNYAWVSKSVIPENRNPNLSFSHHFIVAGLDNEQQKTFLKLAESEDMPVAHLRNKVRKHTHKIKEIEKYKATLVASRLKIECDLYLTKEQFDYIKKDSDSILVFEIGDLWPH